MVDSEQAEETTDPASDGWSDGVREATEPAAELPGNAQKHNKVSHRTLEEATCLAAVAPRRHAAHRTVIEWVVQPVPHRDRNPRAGCRVQSLSGPLSGRAGF